MYLDHFGLREAPFRITPHTDFFFDGANRGATLEALLYAVTHDEGIVKVTGEVGSGKTMLCRMLLERLPASVETIYLANPSLNRDELLFSLADELKISSAPPRIHLLLRELQTHLIKLYSQGRQVVVLVDEAHAMPVETLEEIRLLSNLESRQHKLMQIVLFGQPELNAILSAQNMRQLRERITHNFHLEPLAATDVSTYLMFRLRAAGYHGPDLFTPAALKAFTRSAQGLTRRLNILADKAMLAAFAANTHLVDAAQSSAAIKDAKFEDIAPASRVRGLGKHPVWLGVAVGALAAAVVGFGTWLAMSGPPRATLPGNANPAPMASGGSTSALASAAPAGNVEAATSPNLRLDTQPASLPAAAAVLPPAAALPASPPPPPASRTDVLRQNFDRWLAQADERHHVIQLIRIPAENKRMMENLLDDEFARLDPGQLRVYEAASGGQRWLGLVYGDFAAVSDADAALRALPPNVSRHQPFVRPVYQLKQ